MNFWYLNRLRLMSWPEVMLRLYRWGRHGIWGILLPLVKKKKKLTQKNIGAVESPGDWVISLREKFPITLDQGFWNRYFQFFDPETIKESAEKILLGAIPVFQKRYEYQDTLPDWHRDPDCKDQWPKLYFTRLNHNEVRYGGVLNVWELNRHFHFYDLGKAYYLTGEKRFAQTLMAHMESWVDQNPVGIGINWYSSLEIGVRLISWLWGLFFISERARGSTDFSQIMNGETQQKILGAIYWQTYYIEKNLSKYSSANNHRIGEALALFWVGSLIPTFTRSRKWREKGWKILCREIDRQIFPDGVPKEQSSRYLFFLFDLYALAVIMAQREKRSIPPVLWSRLEKICEYVMNLMDEKGHLPDWGDSADGQACKLYSGNFNPYRSLLTTGALWFKRGDFKAWGGEMDERNYWLFNPEAIGAYAELSRDSKERQSHLFPEGGQVILRKGRREEEAVLSMDAGPFGFLSIAAHAHADALSFVLHLKGEPVMVDPGTYLYHDGGPWRDFFRGTKAHNTVEVDGKDQALSGGPFMWLSRPQGSINKLITGPLFDYVQASHSGYERLSNSLRHERSIFFHKKKTFWIIKDLLSSDGPHTMYQLFHFHPQCILKALNHNLFEISIEKPILYLKLDPGVTCSIHSGEIDPILGWYSAVFGEKVPTITLRGETKIHNRIELQTVFWMP